MKYRVWQHIVCMQINKKKIPEKFSCEQCQSRQTNKERAVQKQNKYLKKLLKKSTSKDMTMSPQTQQQSVKLIDIEKNSDSENSDSDATDSNNEGEINIEAFNKNEIPDLLSHSDRLQEDPSHTNSKEPGCRNSKRNKI